MRQKISVQILTIVIGLCGLSVFGQTQTGRGVRVRMKNERTNSFEEVELYKKSYALVIGESKYKYTSAWNELEGVRDDVPAVEKLLREQGFDEVVVAQDLTRLELDRTIRGFIGKYGLARENRLLIYYAGHGYTETIEDGLKLGYILPIDTPSPSDKPEQFAEIAVSMNDIDSYALSIKAKHVLFIFDSCFSGSVLRKTRSGVPTNITMKAAKPVRQFITSGSEDQVVRDVGLFRQQFEEGLRGETGFNADSNGDGYITGSELGAFLQEKVTNYSNGSQTPLVGTIANSALDKGDIVFVLKKKVKPKPQRTETLILEMKPEEVEQEAWLDIQDSANPQIFREFIKEYPTGANVLKAKIRLEQLVWENVIDSRDKGKMQAYLSEFPNGANAPRARLKLTELNSIIAPPITTGEMNKPKTFKNLIGMEFMVIPAGSFMMGSPKGEAERSNDEKQHRVTIANGFWMGKYEVTIGEWKAVMGDLPEGMKNDLDGKFYEDERQPVVEVSWDDIQKFIKKLNAKGDGTYRLPSEAEWEYAARSGKEGQVFGIGDGKNLSSNAANFDGSYPYGNASKEKYPGKTVAVGSYKANDFGLYDMQGNVWEWMQDWYGAYQSGSVTDPKGPAKGSDRVIRSGNWSSHSVDLRSAYRGYGSPLFRGNGLGFRLVKE